MAFSNQTLLPLSCHVAVPQPGKARSAAHSSQHRLSTCNFKVFGWGGGCYLWFGFILKSKKTCTVKKKEVKRWRLCSLPPLNERGQEEEGEAKQPFDSVPRSALSRNQICRMRHRRSGTHPIPRSGANPQSCRKMSSGMPRNQESF